MEKEHELREKQRRGTIQQMSEAIDYMEKNQKESNENEIKIKALKVENEQISQQLKHLNSNIEQSTKSWVKQEKKFLNQIDQLTKSKISIIKNTDKEISKLRDAIKLLQNQCLELSDMNIKLREENNNIKSTNIWSWAR